MQMYAYYVSCINQKTSYIRNSRCSVFIKAYPNHFSNNIISSYFQTSNNFLFSLSLSLSYQTEVFIKRYLYTLNLTILYFFFEEEDNRKWKVHQGRKNFDKGVCINIIAIIVSKSKILWTFERNEYLD